MYVINLFKYITKKNKIMIYNELYILKQVNYFVSNRDIISVKMVDYALDYGINVISEMKCSIF